MSEIIELIKKRDLDGIRAVIDKDSAAICEKDGNGVSAAYYMVRTGDIDFVRYLVEYTFASFDLCDKNHRSILHEAVLTGSLECVKYIVERVGMSPCLGDKDLITPFQLAHEKGFADIEKYFEETVGAKYENMYHNPVQRGLYADPSIVRVGNDYYMVNSSFIFFPCIPISHSTDLVHWEPIGNAITNPKWAHIEGLDSGCGYWAPDISYHKGRFYITATLRGNDDMPVKRRQLVVSSDKPEGPYSEPVFIDEDGIDPSIFTDVDGKRYMLLNRGARIFELSEDGTRKVSEPKLLFYGADKRAPECPHLLRKDGYYYLFEAEGGTGLLHKITVSRSRTLMGVYEPCPYNPIMTERDLTAPITCCGHGKPVETQNGEWYMVYLCNRFLNGKYSMLGRETCLDPITWTADGWPIINNHQGASALQKRPNLPVFVPETNTGLDSFDGNVLKPQWMFVGIPDEGGVKISGGKLRIKGSAKPLSEKNAKNIVVQRQPDFKFDAICKADLGIELSGDQNYGLTGYYDNYTFFTYGIYKSESGYALKLFEKIDEDEKFSCSAEIPASAGALYLKVSTDGLRRDFYYSIDGENYTKLYTAENIYYLCSEAINKGKRFTGAMIGMYAYGGENNNLIASFDSFECELI